MCTRKLHLKKIWLFSSKRQSRYGEWWCSVVKLTHQCQWTREAGVNLTTECQHSSTKNWFCFWKCVRCGTIVYYWIANSNDVLWTLLEHFVYLFFSCFAMLCFIYLFICFLHNKTVRNIVNSKEFLTDWKCLILFASVNIVNNLMFGFVSLMITPFYLPMMCAYMFLEKKFDSVEIFNAV